ncbi:MAG: nucleotidyl transferase AbiEii/AbiGii toxin family protein [Chloroflexota bacterium]
MRLRKLVAFERLLARLMVAAPDRWVLKGALAFHFRLAARFRTTKDMDLGRWDDERGATDDLMAAQQVDLDDHFRFAIERTAKLDQHVAEKVHAYTRSYAAGHSSSRTKDLVDLVLIASLFPFPAGRLRGALRATFDARGTHPLPATLPSPPAGWGPAYRKLAAELGLQPEVSIGYQHAAAFLDPILGGAASDAAQWDPVRQTW